MKSKERILLKLGDVVHAPPTSGKSTLEQTDPSFVDLDTITKRFGIGQGPDAVSKLVQDPEMLADLKKISEDKILLSSVEPETLGLQDRNIYHFKYEPHVILSHAMLSDRMDIYASATEEEVEQWMIDYPSDSIVLAVGEYLGDWVTTSEEEVDSTL